MSVLDTKLYYYTSGSSYSINLYSSLEDLIGFPDYLAIRTSTGIGYIPMSETSDSTDSYLRCYKNNTTYIIKKEITVPSS